MTLEELCGLSLEKMESLSEAELIEICKPFWNITRPELATKYVDPNKIAKTKSKDEVDKLNKIKLAQQMLAQLGLDVKGKNLK